MKKIVNYSIKQVVFINVCFILLIVAGLYSLWTIPIENMPYVDMGRVIITTVYYGASAEDVEKLVTKKIEDALDGLENIEFIQSISRRNFSSVTVKFIDNTDYKDLYDELRFRVLNIKDELPEEVDDPKFIYLSTQTWMPVVILNLLGDIPNRSLKLLAEELKAEILNIDGVREVTLAGEFKNEFHVLLDPEKLRKLGITFNQVTQAIASAGVKIPTGRFKVASDEYMLSSGKIFSSNKEVLNVVIRKDGDGNFIKVKDVAISAMMSYRDPDKISSTNGLNTLRLLVKKENNANAINIAEAVKKIAQDFENVHKIDRIKCEFTWDSTIEINDSVKVLIGNMALGIILITFILWLTLGFRNAILAAIGIPFSFLCAVVIMKLTGLSINTISLFSFVLVSGIIVDDAVIILENIYRHKQMGKSHKQAIIDGVSEVMLPVISTALTTIFAFIPMLIMTGSTGEFFSIIPKTVTYALIASLLEALFILPIHVLDWGEKKTLFINSSSSKDHFAHLKEGIFAPLWKIYYKVLDFLFKNSFKTLLLSFILFIIAISIIGLSVLGIVTLIKVEFFPNSYFRYHIVITMPRGTSIEKTDAVVRDISRFILSLGKGQAKATEGTAGHYEDEDYTVHYGHHYGQIVVTLPNEKDRKFPNNPDNDLMIHLDYIREKLRNYINKNYPYKKPIIKVFAEETGPPTGKAVNIRVSGNTVNEALKATDAIMEYLRTNKEFSDLTDLQDNRAMPQKVVKYIPLEEAISEYGLKPKDVTSLVAGALNGVIVGKYRSKDEEVDLIVKLARVYDNNSNIGLSDPTDILNIPIIEHSYSPIFIRDLVKMEYSEEPDIRTRYNGKPTITITANIKAGSKLSSSRVQMLVKNFFDSIAINYPGVTISFGGEFESTKRAYTSLGFAFFIAILAIYLVLASEFKSYIHPLIVLSAVSFAIIGVSYGMFITRQTFTVASFIAVIGLAGIAVNDSLILVDFINARRREGIALREAIIQACSARMRPVLITTITTMLGLLPMAIGIPRKSITWSPMATAFVTGLTSATILTLLIIPIEYEFSERLKAFFRKNKK